MPHTRRYISLVLNKRHVAGRGKVEECTWRLCTFYAFVNYHIKCSKAHMHTRMRRRTMGLLQVLHLTLTLALRLGFTPDGMAQDEDTKKIVFKVH